MAIYNQDLTDTDEFDLRSLIIKYGPPHFPTKRNAVGTLNELFWSAFFATNNEVIYENHEGGFYRYGGKIYDQTSEHLLRGQLANDILRASKEWLGYEPLSQLCNAKNIAGVISHLKGMTQKEEAFENPSGRIHVANGVLELDNGSIKLLPFSPQLISRNLIPIRYEPDATCNRFKSELLGLLDVDDRELLQKFLGLFLLGRNIVQKMLILHGIGETGKSTFSEVARKLIGVTNCSELRTQLLHERFEIGSYIGKNLLIGADVASTFLNSRGAYRLKALVGGDLLDAERKNANYRFQLPGRFNVLVTSNSRLTARLENDRGPWARRLAIVEYEKPRNCKIIPEFAEMLIREEGSGILLFACAGLHNVWSDIKEHGTIQLTATQRKRVESLLDESDGLRLFLQASVKRDLNSSLTTAEIVEAYAAFALNKGWNMSIGQTEQELPDLMMEMFQVAKSHNVPSPTTSKGVRGYRGVAFA